MYIIVPNNNNGSLHKIEKNLDKLNFKQIDTNYQDYIVHLPKFRIKTKLDLGSIMTTVSKCKFIASIKFLFVGIYKKFYCLDGN